MMIEAAAIAPPVLVADAVVEPQEGTPRWATLAADLRFFLICYLAGLIVFLVMLS
ncbi:hypothetical protein [Sphingomonas sp.]|uniref:hypothetical protein n=1 Tax=Sphingomonas sp. TaxID=28214 RepID=UPI003B009F37